MTKEQIKQNAEEYASKLVERYYHEDIWLDLYDAFMSGAHSRDEDIEQLEERMKVLDMNLVEQQLENLQLSNPWISVEERLPEHSVDVLIVSNYGDLNEFHVAMLNPYGFWQTSDCMIIDEGVFAWMPIPLIKKGK